MNGGRRTADGAMEAMAAVLTRTRAFEASCQCPSCQTRARHDKHRNWQCGRCMFVGQPILRNCSCETLCLGDIHCPQGCNHGDRVCPRCNNGENDGWAVVHEMDNLVKSLLASR